MFLAQLSALGPIPPSIFCPLANKTEDASGQVKVKRKCGRPRNPIPRHKRESHINAEHRRRGKIQNGFRTLKNMVPRYEQTSGRDSKADILFKAVDHCKLLQRDIQEITGALDAVRLEKEGLDAEIKSLETRVPDMSLYKELTTGMNEMYEDYVKQRTNSNDAFWAFHLTMSPLFESYKASVRGRSMGDFLVSVAEWTKTAFSGNFKEVCMASLRDGISDFQKDGSDVDGASFSDNLPGHTSPQSMPYPGDSDYTLGSNPYKSQMLTQSPDHLLQSPQAPMVQDYSRTPTFTLDQNPAGSAEPTGHRHEASDSLSSSVDDHRALANFSPHLTMSHPAELSFLDAGTGNPTCSDSSSLCDVYLNLDHDQLQGYQRQEAWQQGNDLYPKYHLQHQPNLYQTDHIIPSASSFDLNKVHSFWATSYLPDDYDHTLALPMDRYEDLTPKLHPSNMIGDHARVKSLSQSSNESESSMLTISSLARQATETLRNREAQLSPSTDGCLSPATNTGGTSPSALRNMDQLMANRALLQDSYLDPSMETNESYTRSLSNNHMALPSYNETFGGQRTADQRTSDAAEMLSKRFIDFSSRVKHDGHSKAKKLTHSPLLAELLLPQNPTTQWRPFRSSTEENGLLGLEKSSFTSSSGNISSFSPSSGTISSFGSSSGNISQQLSVKTTSNDTSQYLSSSVFSNKLDVRYKPRVSEPKDNANLMLVGSPLNIFNEGPSHGEHGANLFHSLSSSAKGGSDQREAQFKSPKEPNRATHFQFSPEQDEYLKMAQYELSQKYGQPRDTQQLTLSRDSPTFAMEKLDSRELNSYPISNDQSFFLRSLPTPNHRPLTGRKSSFEESFPAEDPRDHANSCKKTCYWPEGAERCTIQNSEDNLPMARVLTRGSPDRKPVEIRV
ncbi:uncharacterized protein LOC131943204 isoform X2 [Physella acuta]|uniref:uncharacterized protein LOC131943204 isoform X2 n=1 Tax=Physella acuta TaxID=109671 RepID=UPI0027DC4413|nr:uncharacterized protein LOC131943204 isoform X2 [Physella acuta]